jgi:hypothetical protein
MSKKRTAVSNLSRSTKETAKQVIAVTKAVIKNKQKKEKQVQSKLIKKSKSSSQKVFSIRELSSRQYVNLSSYLSDIEKHSDKLDAMLKEGELFGFAINDNYSHYPVATGKQLINYMMKYKELIKNGSDKRYRESLIDSIKIIILNSPEGTEKSAAESFQKKRAIRVKQFQKEKESVREIATKIVLGEDKPRKLSTFELLKDVVSIYQADQKRMDELERRAKKAEKQLEKFVKQFTKPAKKQASKPAKKQASKPAKKQASKPAKKQASKPAKKQASKPAKKQTMKKRGRK